MVPLSAYVAVSAILFATGLIGVLKGSRHNQALYLETLKMYSNLAIQRGAHSLFFPGGTRSRSGQIEIAVKKFWARLGDVLPHPSITDMGLVMAQIEVVHNRAYEKLLDVLQLNHFFEENLKLDIINGRVKHISLPTAMLIAKALEVPVEDLFEVK